MKDCLRRNVVRLRISSSEIMPVSRNVAFAIRTATRSETLYRSYSIVKLEKVHVSVLGLNIAGVLAVELVANCCEEVFIDVLAHDF